ncbi:M3 family metallopeptidase [Iodobacter fluviatilis]|uniref:Peptidyl-dipeptidase Dcp n=1 Tax=Iodobacter fluviatilis TaxID=537 RepID=A0A377SX36_9NEIS|nr:M3 family metallopeptidase [Iodobacter fluviatilis]TCU88052.1 peptidyl-dipeptidase Dcp [Iodobacter fluviatilis]STR45553.1 Peptidyl-dipeptidase dcp [Iodobacter fluviatilis]
MHTERNPLLQEWQTPFGLPPFDQILPGHFPPAFAFAMAQHRAELNAIAEQTSLPDFANSVERFALAGSLLARINGLFENLTASETNPELEAIELTLAPQLAAHNNMVYQQEGVFTRINALYQQRKDLGLNTEKLRLLERIRLNFVRNGAELTGESRLRFSEIVAALATLCTQFSQNVRSDEAQYRLQLHDENDLAGLPESIRASAKQAAADRGTEGCVITLSRSSVVPFLTYSSRRDLREIAHKAWKSRGEHPGKTDNRPIAARILALRQEQAQLLGYANFADYALSDRMAGTPHAALDLLQKVWAPALKRVLEEQADLQTLAAELGEPLDIEPWDWFYLAEQQRLARFDLDDAEIKPYFALENMIAAAFDCAHRLFGLSFKERFDLPLYHPDARLWEVSREGEVIGLFIGDNFSRTSKQGGAWMHEFRSQSRSEGKRIVPIVINNNNFSKAPAGQATLLSFDDVRTLFHEFGHGLHGLLSDVEYSLLAGPAVARDYVELPSQLFENWAGQDEVLKKHALHIKTGEAIPDTLLAKIKNVRFFNQGFETVRYLGSALLDLQIHLDLTEHVQDIGAFEAATLEKIGLPKAAGINHRLPHFGHLFSSDGYAAGYYVYMWAEVLEADTFNAFIETGNAFDPATAERLYRTIYSVGNSIDPASAWLAFRGRPAEVSPLLAKRGLN